MMRAVPAEYVRLEELSDGYYQIIDGVLYAVDIDAVVREKAKQESNGGCGRTQTNADKIRSMTDEELAILCEDGCPPGAPICNSVETIEGETVKEHCQRCWLSWLKATVEEKQT